MKLESVSANFECFGEHPRQFHAGPELACGEVSRKLLDIGPIEILPVGVICQGGDFRFDALPERFVEVLFPDFGRGFYHDEGCFFVKDNKKPSNSLKSLKNFKEF